MHYRLTEGKRSPTNLPAETPNSGLTRGEVAVDAEKEDDDDDEREHRHRRPLPPSPFRRSRSRREAPHLGFPPIPSCIRYARFEPKCRKLSLSFPLRSFKFFRPRTKTA
ncbi:hypothetical protein BHE74_00023851 [Ensete ventricosum]|nr:hypothetical protein GW17_00023787 [Ensete ventricosum]RWW68624.1 hypothetical protein BHE74_00023851 [Ensete ventricosum]